jgi:hypothetical protein
MLFGTGLFCYWVFVLRWTSSCARERAGFRASPGISHTTAFCTPPHHGRCHRNVMHPAMVSSAREGSIGSSLRSASVSLNFILITLDVILSFFLVIILNFLLFVILNIIRNINLLVILLINLTVILSFYSSSSSTLFSS